MSQNNNQAAKASVVRRNNVKVLGSGTQALIFCHGFGCDQGMWQSVFPAFEADYKIILFDQVGAGKSDDSCFSEIKYATLGGYADDIIEICQELNLSQVIFVGHSVGATIGILAANKSPQYFSKLILIGPSPSYIDDGDYVGGFKRQDITAMLESTDRDYFTWARAMAPAIMGNPDRPELGVELTNSFCRTNPSIARHFARTLFLSDNRNDLPLVKVSTLILQCSQDMVAPEVVGRYVHSKIAGSVFKKLKAVGHCPHVSAPAEVIEVMHEFLESTPS